MGRFVTCRRSLIFSIFVASFFNSVTNQVARAGAINISFSGLTPSASVPMIENDNYSQISSLMNNADTMIANFMKSSLPVGSSVSVNGALIQSQYDGEGHVVGPTFGTGRSKTVVPWTLGDTGHSNGHLTPPSSSNPAYTSFLTNAGFPFSNPVSCGITMTFSNLLISAVSFDFEVFPDGTGQTPDLTFSGTNNGKAVSISSVAATTYNGLSYTGAFGSNNDSWTTLGVKPSVYTSSPDGSNETSIQLLGNASFTFSSPVNALQFEDWPALIGINSLSISGTGVPNQQVVPAPPSIVMLGFGELGLVIFLPRTRRRLFAVV
jgi:hypothetical protein